MINRIRRGHWVTLDYLAAGAYALLVLPMLAKYASGPLCRRSQCWAGWARSPGRSRCAATGRWRHWACWSPDWPWTLLVEPRAYIAAIVPMACVLYLAATGPRRIAFVALGTSLASAAAAALPTFAHLGATLASGLGYLTVWTVGYAVGMHRRYTAELLRHQATLAQAELARARRDVTEERLRIARELHDVIAHSMSVITVQAAYGALVIDTQPAPARSALEAIENTGRQTLSELRTLLGVLRTADQHDAPRASAAGPVSVAGGPGPADHADRTGRGARTALRGRAPADVRRRTS